MTRNIPLRSDKTRDGKSETGKRITLIQSLMRKLRYVKRIQNDRQRILDEILGTIQHSIRFEREKENPAYTERITETNSRIMQEINSTYIQRISSLLQRKLRKTMEGKLCAQSIRSYRQKSLFDQKKLRTGKNQKISECVESIERILNGTDSRIWISSLIVPSQISRYSEVFT